MSSRRPRQCLTSESASVIPGIPRKAQHGHLRCVDRKAIAASPRGPIGRAAFSRTVLPWPHAHDYQQRKQADEKQHPHHRAAFDLHARRVPATGGALTSLHRSSRDRVAAATQDTLLLGRCRFDDAECVVCRRQRFVSAAPYRAPLPIQGANGGIS